MSRRAQAAALTHTYCIRIKKNKTNNPDAAKWEEPTLCWSTFSVAHKPRDQENDEGLSRVQLFSSPHVIRDFAWQIYTHVVRPLNQQSKHGELRWALSWNVRDWSLRNKGLHRGTSECWIPIFFCRMLFMGHRRAGVAPRRESVWRCWPVHQYVSVLL